MVWLGVLIVAPLRFNFNLKIGSLSTLVDVFAIAACLFVLHAKF